MEKKSYAGKIKNTGSQKVDALFPTPNSGGNTVRRADDLRTGKGRAGNSRERKGGKLI